MRRGTFLSLDPWKNPPWKPEYPFAYSSLHTLLDIAGDIATLLDASNHLKLEQSLGKLDPTTAFQKQHDLLQSMLHCYQELEFWYSQSASPDKEDYPFAPRQMEWDNLALDPEEQIKGKIFPTALTFREFPDAMALTHFDAIKINLVGFIAENLTRTPEADSSGLHPDEDPRLSPLQRAKGVLRSNSIHASAVRICQSIPYFFEKEKVLVGPCTIMFPFHVAGNAFHRLSSMQPGGPDAPPGTSFRRELRWCRMVSRKYEAMGLPSLESLDIGRGNTPDA